MKDNKQVRMYVDVDGCINASHSKLEWDDAPSRGSASPEGEGGFQYNITWSQAMIDDLSLLDVEIVWLTTWCEAAPVEIGGLTGFGRNARVLRPLGGGNISFPSIGWKVLSLIDDQQNDPSPYIWIDDELSDQMSVIVDEVGLKYAGLYIRPIYIMGISKHQVGEMDKFIQSSSSHVPDGPATLDPGPGPVDPG